MTPALRPFYRTSLHPNPHASVCRAANFTEANGSDLINFMPALLPQPCKFSLTRLTVVTQLPSLFFFFFLLNVECGLFSLKEETLQ